MKTLEQALTLLNNHSINPGQEIIQKLDSRELVALVVHWPPISKSAGLEKIGDIIGDGYTVEWFPNNAEYRITLKK